MKRNINESETFKNSKKITDLTRKELMELVYCLNQCMIDYENDIERAMAFSEKQEWESLKEHHMSDETKKSIMIYQRINSTKKSR